MSISFSQLAPLNAGLNAVAAVLLLSGYFFIRRRWIRAHRACMVSAFVVSTLFLISYSIYHYHVGDVPFKGRGWLRPFYFSLLSTHVVLSVVIVPLAIVTLLRAVGGRFPAHRRIARRTLPIWLYVSVTGVVVYLMVYVLYP